MLETYTVIKSSWNIQEKQIRRASMKISVSSLPRGGPVQASTAMYASGNLLAKELKYSDFGIDEGSPGEGFLEDYGSTVFIGQTVLDNLYFLAVNTRSFDLHFPLNQQATRLLRNQALKIYGGTIAVRQELKEKEHYYAPVAVDEFLHRFKEFAAHNGFEVGPWNVQKLSKTDARTVSAPNPNPPPAWPSARGAEPSPAASIPDRPADPMNVARGTPKGSQPEAVVRVDVAGGQDLSCGDVVRVLHMGVDKCYAVTVPDGEFVWVPKSALHWLP
jgi:hypothetical protein